MANMNGKDFLLGAVTGAVIGAVTALLLAPKSGRELRGDIATQYHNVAQKTQEIAGTVKSKSQEWAGKAKEVAGHVADDIRSWKEGRDQSAAAIEASEEEQ